MSITDVSNLFGFFGGLGMFLYGMRIMGDGMQKTAGSKMNHFLGMVTNNRILGVLLGALITAILHSSAATTVMVVGFVNAGILNLTQAVGVIMGANIGTTVTAWLVSLSELSGAMAIFQPSFFAPLFMGIGAFQIVFSKKQKNNLIGEILSGVGLLFIGLGLMSSAIKPYTGLPIFATAFAVLGKNPILGIATGAIVTALIQSSTASVGILQTLAMNGVVNTGAAIYITLGQNIGTCLTALLSSAGANRTAKRAAAIHFSFNTLGAAIFGVLMFVISIVRPDISGSHIDAVGISTFHTIFNVSCTLILFPFANQLVKLSDLLVKDNGTAEEEKPLTKADDIEKHLDSRIFESPAIAIEVAEMEANRLGDIALKSFRIAKDALITGNNEKLEKVYRNEKDMDRITDSLTKYLIKVNNLSLTERQTLLVSDLFYSISDMERVGDHCENLAELADYMKNNGLEFSTTGKRDLELMSEKVERALFHAMEARKNSSLEDVRIVNKYEDWVDNIEEELRNKHIHRLSSGECNSIAGATFLNIIGNLERISDHAVNIADYVKNEV